eukprot:TRINITY_DN8964_c0_g1_i1.p1 TRINITY_DN8964_c0_g1~~TRINITY_DN8964_c0_g1_i1.p1  ORF type:complete len:463 (+),score=74.87 TRINITY_DN8964_c0_g1_i1:93-1481(+)
MEDPALPDAVLGKIFLLCPSINDLVRWQSVNRQFRLVGSTELIWKPLVIAEYEDTKFGEGEARTWFFDNCRRVFLWRRWLAMLLVHIDKSGAARYSTSAVPNGDEDGLGAAAMALRFRGKRTPARRRLEDFAEFLDLTESSLKPNSSPPDVQLKIARLTELVAKIESLDLKPYRDALLAIVQHLVALVTEFHNAKAAEQSSERIADRFLERLELIRTLDKSELASRWEASWLNFAVYSLASVCRQPDGLLPSMCAASWCLALLSLPEDGQSAECEVCGTAAADTLVLRRRERRDKLKLRTSHVVFFACSYCVNPFGACAKCSGVFRDDACRHSKDARPHRMLDAWRSVRPDYADKVVPRVEAKRASLAACTENQPPVRSAAIVDAYIAPAAGLSASDAGVSNSFADSPEAENQSVRLEEESDDDEDATELSRPSAFDSGSSRGALPTAKPSRAAERIAAGRR